MRSAQNSMRAFVLSLALVIGASAPAARAQINPQIVGGTPTTAEARPYNVVLATRQGVFCGGSIIKPDRILTAQHCTFDPDGIPFRASDLVVVAGLTTLSERGQSRAVASIERVPGFDIFGFNQRGKDLAVLTLTSPLTLGPRVQVIDYAFTGMDGRLEREGTPVTVAGFGSTRFGGPGSDRLLEVTVPVANRRAASQAYRFPIRQDFLPAGGGRRDSCQGDSGSALVASRPDGSLVQVGLVSFGEGCGMPGFPGIYTRVRKFRAFIDRNAGRPMSLSDLSSEEAQRLDSELSGELREIEQGRIPANAPMN